MLSRCSRITLIYAGLPRELANFIVEGVMVVLIFQCSIKTVTIGVYEDTAF